MIELSESTLQAYKHVESLQPDSTVGGGFLFYGHKVREAYEAGYASAAAVKLPENVRQAAERADNRVYDQEGCYYDGKNYYGAASDAALLAEFLLRLAAEKK